MLKKKRYDAAAPVESKETVITRSTSLEGTLKSDGAVRILGTMEGHLEVAGTVIVGPEARVQADVQAHHVAVAGVLKGNVKATEHVEILAGGTVYGDIAAPSLRIEEGALFSGQSVMGPARPEALPAEPS